MYQRVEWMKAADQSILQLLGSPKQIALTSSNISYNTGLSRGYTSERLNKLVDKGLVNVEKEEGSHPYYSISSEGQDFLDGELNPEELNRK